MVRMALWLRGAWLGADDADARLWLQLDDGRVAALRLPAGFFEDDSLVPVVTRQLRDGTDTPHLPGGERAVALPAAPVTPLPALAWGDPRHETARRFAAALDQDILRCLAVLNEPWTFDSVANYNRLALLDPERRRRWFQALERFPLLAAPVLLTAHTRLDAADPAPTPRDAAPAVIEAVERGRDLTGALARHEGVSRSLVRAPVCRWTRPFPDLDRRLLLYLVDGIPAHRRPKAPTELAAARELLRPLLALLDHPGEARRLGATALKAGLAATQESLERRFAPLEPALADSRDFCRAAVATADVPLSPRRLALAWMQQRGIASLLAASRRWHRFATETEEPTDTGEILPTIYGDGEYGGLQIRELRRFADFEREGREMRHCVASYWDICRRGRSRIFALAHRGERGTAEYAFDPEPEEHGGRFRLVQLRGPDNAEVSEALARAAAAFETVLNDPRRTEARRRIAVDYHRRHVDEGNPGLHPLDPRSRRELAAVLAAAETARHPRQRLRTWIAGYQYHQGEWVEAYLSCGTPLRLVREPDNPHDPLAVRVEWQGIKLGYIPRRDNGPIAHRLDAGTRLRCRVLRLQREAPPWQRLHLGIEMPPYDTP